MSVAARLRGLLAGLPAIVWEADARTWEFTFVSEGAEELLGYPAEQWLGDAGFWPRSIHPDDRDEAVRFCAQGTADGRDYDFSYRAVAADGRILWVHDVVHVVCDAEGVPRELQGVMIDITEQKCRERAAALSAECARLLAGAGTVEDRLTAAAECMIGELGDVATVWLRSDDGRFRPVAAAPAAVATGVLTLAPITLPDELEAAYPPGRPFVLPQISEELLRAVTEDDAHYQAVAAIGSQSALVAPLLSDGRVVGSLTLVATEAHHRYEEADLALTEDLGRRIAAMMSAERVARRLKLLQQATAELSGAATPGEVAATVVRQAGRLLGTSAVGVWQLLEVGTLDALDLGGWNAPARRGWGSIPLDARTPASDAARRREPVWTERIQDWQRDYPQLLGTVHDYGYATVDVVPMLVAGRCLGVICFGYTAERVLGPPERATVLALVDQCAQALQRAQLLTAESTARRAAEQFGHVVAALSGATDLAAVGQVILDYAPSVGGDAAVVVLRSEDDPDRLDVLAATANVAVGEALAVDAAHPLAHAVRSAEPIWHGVASDDGRLPAQVALPLVVGDAAVGAVGLRFADPVPALTPDQRTVIQTFAGQCAQAVERVRLQRAERSARTAAESAATRLRALVSGLAAIVWEADARTVQFTFVSEQAQELLGYPPQQWLGDPGFWPSIIHPDDRDEAVRFCSEETAAGRDHDFSYRAITADRQTVWLHDVVHVVCDDGGNPVQLQGVMIDITATKRTEHSAALLVEVGRLLAEPGPLQERLTRMLRVTVNAFADLAVVSLAGLDGRFTPTAAACPAQPELEALILGIAPTRMPAELVGRYRAGRPFHLPAVPDALLREFAADPADYRARRALGARSVLLVPLVVQSRLVATVSFVSTTRARRHDAADLALAGELGQRVALVIEAERVATRERQLRQVTAALASAHTLTDAAAALAAGVAAALDAAGVAVYSAQTDSPQLNLVHIVGYPTEVAEAFSVIRTEADLPAAEATRTAQPVWLSDRRSWQSRYPHLAVALADIDAHAAAALPLQIGGRVVGVLTASFPTAREFASDERSFALTLVGQAAQAFERAAIADERRSLAETLQRSLLPSTLPALCRLALTARYQPGAHAIQAGGDWYDVLDLDPEHVCLIVGDVVGRGAAAAAVMGQLRSALASNLLQGQPPAQALAHLNRFAARIAGARVSTATAMILNTRTGDLCWACAGHPPPLVVDHEGTPRYLEDGRGPCLGVSDRLPFREGHTRLEPTACLLLYTDGLIERRGEPIDDGLDRLAGLAAQLCQTPPEQFADQLLEQLLVNGSVADDVALVIARLLPPPLHTDIDATPAGTTVTFQVTHGASRAGQTSRGSSE